MNLHKLTARKLTADEAAKLISEESGRIFASCAPEDLILFGSAARNEMTEVSDLDFVAIFKDAEALKKGKEAYYQTRSPSGTAVDIIFVSRFEFERRSRVGGVCFVARLEGRPIKPPVSDQHEVRIP